MGKFDTGLDFRLLDIGILDGQWLFRHLVEGTFGQNILSEEH